MIYVKVKKSRVKDLIEGVYNLSRPFKDPADVSKYFGEIYDGKGQWSVWVLPEVADLPIHETPDKAKVEESLSSSVSEGNITSQEFNGIMAAIQENKGKKIDVRQMLPPSWTANILTKQQAIDQGYILDE